MIWISDTHFGNGLGGDDFKTGAGTRRQFRDMVSYAKETNQKIGLVGDIFELWKFDIEEIFEEYELLLSELFPQVKIYVVGNHDEELFGKTIGEEFGNGVEVIENCIYEYPNGEKAWVEHGHAYDPKHDDWLGKTGSKVTTRIENYFPYFNSVFLNIWHRLFMTGRYSYKESDSYNLKVANSAYQNDCDFAIFGHTHDLYTKTVSIDKAVEVVEEVRVPHSIGRMEIINCGCWVDGQIGGQTV